MSGPEDEYQDPHGQCTDEILRLTAELDGARADRAQTTSDALVVVIRIRDERDEALAELESAVSQIAVLRDERDVLAAEVERLHGAWDCDGEVHGPWCREWRKMEAEAGRLRSALAPATMTKLEAWEVLSRCDSGYQQCAKCPALACCDNDAGRALLKKGGGA